MFKGLDTGEYIFYGEVTGYTTLKTPFCERVWVENRQCTTVWGVEMAVVGAVQLPRPEVNRIQCYRFGSRGDCSRTTVDKEQTMKQFPIGTVYKVIAHPLNVIEEPAQPGLQLLDGSGLSKNLLIPVPPRNNVAALLVAKADYSPVRGGQFDEFEFKKDLMRLNTARSQQQTVETLTRLADFPWRTGTWGAFGPDAYMDLVRQYVTDAHSIQELRKLHDTTRYFDGTLKGQAADDLLLARAKEGEAEFQYHLGRRLAESDPQSAIAWFQRASDQNFVAADFELGYIYYRLAHEVKGEESHRLRQMGSKVHMRAARRGAPLAEQGDAWAALMLADMHSNQDAGLTHDQKTIDRYICLGTKNRPLGYPRKYIGQFCK